MNKPTKLTDVQLSLILGELAVEHCDAGQAGCVDCAAAWAEVKVPYIPEYRTTPEGALRALARAVRTWPL